MNVLCISVTEPGRGVARRLPFAHVHGDAGDTLESRWGSVDGFVLVLAVGAAVRLIAPLLTDKSRDPAVVCVDDAGRYAVVVCGGHAGGGNALAVQVAGLLGAEPVVTTATDRLGVAALDQLPGLRAEGDVAAVTATMLGGWTVAVDDEVGWPLPDALAALGGPGPGRTHDGEAARVVVTDRTAGVAAGPPPTVVLRPPSLVVGVGCSSDASPEEVRASVAEAMASAGLSEAAIGRVATIDRRADHPAVVALSESLGAPVTAYPAGVLDRIAVPTPSQLVRAAVGTSSVAEAAATAAAGPGASLVVEKRIAPRVTVAVARRRVPAGSVSVVGLGPGGPLHRTPAAEAAVRHAEVVIGYRAYLDQCADLIGPAQRVVPYPLGAELDRVRAALEAAAGGRRVALVCSGDAGVYAMASPLLELAAGTGDDDPARYAAVEIEVVPGVTASLSASAVLGAPLGHDHAVVSLSDLHTPWDHIARRIRAAGRADLVLALYNPRSLRRTWQIEEARHILLEDRAPGTPVGLVTDAGRPGQHARITTLGEMATAEITMTTCVIVGASSTRVLGGRMVTPRGYDR